MEISGVPLEAHITAHERYNGKSVHVELGQTRRVVSCGVSNRADVPQSVFTRHRWIGAASSVMNVSVW